MGAHEQWAICSANPGGGGEGKQLGPFVVHYTLLNSSWCKPIRKCNAVGFKVHQHFDKAVMTLGLVLDHFGTSRGHNSGQVYSLSYNTWCSSVYSTMSQRKKQACDCPSLNVCLTSCSFVTWSSSKLILHEVNWPPSMFLVLPLHSIVTGFLSTCLRELLLARIL